MYLPIFCSVAHWHWGNLSKSKFPLFQLSNPCTNNSKLSGLYSGRTVSLLHFHLIHFSCTFIYLLIFFTGELSGICTLWVSLPFACVLHVVLFPTTGSSHCFLVLFPAFVSSYFSFHHLANIIEPLGYVTIEVFQFILLLFSSLE